MAEFWHNFHFLRPWLLLLLALPLWGYWRYFKGVKNQSSWEKVCDKKLLDFLLVKGSARQRKNIGYIGLAGMLAAVIAAAGPSWEKKEIPSLAPENPLMLVLNLSSDMEERDITPSRLERAKFTISDLLKLVKTPQAGLIVYSDEPFLISPITEDARIVSNLLPSVVRDIMPVNGDRLDRAIDLAAEKMKNAGYAKGNIIVLTAEAGQRFDLTLAEAKKIKSAGFILNIIGMSKEKSEKLQLIAEAGGGRYLPYTSGDVGIRQLARQINTQTGDLKISENLRSQWLDAGYWLVFLPLLCCLYFFRRGIVWSLLFFIWTGQAQAGFFLNNNQEGLRAFRQEDYQKAAEKFDVPAWKGSSFYRLGDYQKAYEYFAGGKDATALYNQGNALAKAGKTEEAIKKYEEVLQQDPQHEDAKFNLEYLKKQQEQNQQQQNNQGQQNNQQQNQQQQNQPQNGENQQDSEQQSGENQEQEQNPEQGQQPDNSDAAASQAEGQNQPEQNQTQPMNGQQPQEADSREDQPQSGSGEEVQEEEFDEEAQARAQQYREIPENPGGLLKAFIRREYMKKRYEE
ncbi:MAG: tetratricopeptide repeat protein [Alphaproteobacteria bacterium]|nr:tetratricopeptide repeat protein [Alphaproteobacteria bacterium]